MIALDNDI